MAWTDDRVSTLRRLWASGRSASQIADELGGVTRNAVIGKVHRLGLSGRDRAGTGAAAQAVLERTKAKAAPPRKAAAARPKPAAAKPAAAKPAGAKPAPTKPKPASRPLPQSAARSVQRKVPPARQSRPPVQEPPSRARPMPSKPRIPQAVRDMAGRPFQAPAEAVRQGDGRFATVLTITDHMCKWPIGDPGADDFRFCGRMTDPEEPYCLAHSRVAYQPSRRRGGGNATALPPVMRRKAIR